METPLKSAVLSTMSPAAPDAARPRARQIMVLKILVATTFAVLIPSPTGGWPPISLLLWGLIGDPESGMETLACIGGGGGLLAFYTVVLFAALTITIRGVAQALRATGVIGGAR